ncbi:Imm8 family immunity protein [Pseudovibrio sp. Ad37]|uniref:Imm8 family immunity protein n=1 Tax=Pseudovibrio sp. Ad37 TaxID=989422 RepID=UPI0007AE615D|nr:Imm8 family immunity protein [Pseudovibrio sp. Ad37]KZL14861.1 hypothetical protein PsAD37_04739 [Pseudovibrio sp. Ad37]
MQAELKQLTSLDIDPKTYWPDVEDSFSFTLDAHIGPKGEATSELFQFHVCTPKWAVSNMVNKTFGDFGFFGIYMILVEEYDFERIQTKISQLCSEINGESWSDVAIQLSRYAMWEYANYQQT